jgi:beta-glucanase (GH16 family)
MSLFKTTSHFISVIVPIICLCYCTSMEAKREKVDWRLVWSDEFDYTGLPDPAKWSFEVKPPKWVNGELQNYTGDRPENCRVENGVLVIEARNDHYENLEYSSARIKTKGKGDWLYCRVEVRAKLPSGRGTWPAIWMMPTNEGAYGRGWPDSGEIDIMEHVGYDPGKIHATTHTKKYNWMNNNQKTAVTTVADCSKEFHVYSVEWYPDRIEIHVDDNVYFTNRNDGTGWQAWPFDKSFYLILNLAIGGSWGGLQGVDNSIFPQRMEVDYVRVYENPAYPIEEKIAK